MRVRRHSFFVPTIQAPSKIHSKVQGSMCGNKWSKDSHGVWVNKWSKDSHGVWVNKWSKDSHMVCVEISGRRIQMYIISIGLLIAISQ